MFCSVLVLFSLPEIYAVAGLMLAFRFLSSPRNKSLQFRKDWSRNTQDPSLLFENVNPNWKDPQETEGLWTSEKMFTKQVGHMICWLSSQ